MIGYWEPFNFALDALFSAPCTCRPGLCFWPLARTRVLLALVTDPFQIFHQLIFQLLSSGQFPRILILVEYAPSSWMAPPLQTPLPWLAMTIISISSQSSEYQKLCSGTHPVNIHPLSLFRFLSLLQHLEQISTDAAQKKSTTH